ncbi:DUF1805 domain-containing protein [Candidatus Micrarchaeota archaeon]|nr:MAG: DUF1805 domain-containing protein [Candidatus Micrarchaeota archaeon]
MVLTEIIETEHGAALGIRIAIGDSRTPLLIIRAEKGYLASDYLNKEKIEREGDAACIVRNARDFKDMMEKRVSWVSSAARKLGIKSRMRGHEALDLMV